MKNYMPLKSGTDVRGVASDIFGSEINITNQAVADITYGFAMFLANKTGKPYSDLKVAVGHDSRISAERIKLCVIESLVKAGITVLDCGLSSTPAMFMTTVDANTDGAVQITASHHPADRNGLKFFTKLGGLDGCDVEDILKIAQSEDRPKTAEGKIIPTDFMATYAAGLRKMICDGLKMSEGELPLKGFHIVVDAGNGAGGFYATNVLEPLGADTSGSVFLNPDGMFPNHIPNPENKAAMESICGAVKKSGADLGIIFDTDVDRAGCVDKSGNEINRNRLIALAAAIVIEDNPGATIVTDSVTSDGLKIFIEKDLHGKHHRFKRGYKNVINEAVRLCNEGTNSPLAIETSGHAALKENYFLDDGAYLVTKIVIKLAALRKDGKDLDDLIGSLACPVEADELRFNITCPDFKDYGTKVIAALEEFVKADSCFKIADDNREGIRVSVPDGWFLLRLSVHDPIMPINVESNHEGGVRDILQKLYPFFKAQISLDISSLDSRLK